MDRAPGKRPYPKNCRSAVPEQRRDEGEELWAIGSRISARRWAWLRIQLTARVADADLQIPYSRRRTPEPCPSHAVMLHEARELMAAPRTAALHDRSRTGSTDPPEPSFSIETFLTTHTTRRTPLPHRTTRYPAPSRDAERAASQAASSAARASADRCGASTATSAASSTAR